MSTPRPELVLIGQVLVAADGSPATAGAIGIHGDRVAVVGTPDEVRAVAAPGARVVDEPESAIVPGLHDFHLHLVGMARARREVRLEGLHGADLLHAVRTAVRRGEHDWVRGRGWSEAAMTRDALMTLNAELRGRPVLLYSEDTHSAWASPAALAIAGIGLHTADPAGGRIERLASGDPSGLLRERAADMVEAVAGRLRGEQLDAALDEVLAELAGWGITGATDAGDTTSENGVGDYAALGDRASLLLAAAGRLDGRLRASIGFPAEAIPAAAELGLRSGERLAGTATLSVGWAKAYADGALGSRTAAVFEPYTCLDQPQRGIVRLEPRDLDELVVTARRARVGLAVHAIGDRAAADVVAALERGERSARGVPPDRMEHLQLLRPDDRRRIARAEITASVQPMHCAVDRELVERCWAGRQEDAYPWRSLQRSGALLAFGSDAPIGTANPWHGIFAAVHRHAPGDGTPDWYPGEALDPLSGLRGYTLGPARASLAPDRGHLRPGALADLAVLDRGLDDLLAADEGLGSVRSVLTLVGGREVHRA